MRNTALLCVCAVLLSFACQADPDSETNWDQVPNDGLQPTPPAPTSSRTAEPPGPFFREPPRVDGGPWGQCEPEVLAAVPLVGEIEEQVAYEAKETVAYEVVVEEVLVEEPERTLLYLMLDRSTSMGQSEGCNSDDLFTCVGKGPTKWELAVEGVRRFVADPGEQDLELALGYFPALQALTGVCDGTGYDTPVVPGGALPNNDSRILSSLSNTTQSGFTPTAGALRGLLSYCLQHRSANPKERCVGVLITDGSPSQCEPQDVFGLASLAKAGASEGIQIFTAGMSGADFDVLDAVARAGNADCTPDEDKGFACDLTGDPDALADALRRIAAEPLVRVQERTVTEERVQTVTKTRTETRTGSLPCEWGLPAMPGGEELDPELVNVRVGMAGAWHRLGWVESGDACRRVETGWFFDDPTQPATVRACAETCDVLKRFGDTLVEIELGCRSIPAVPLR